MEKSSTCFSDLSSGILSNILAKLPTKTIFFCRSISKLWRDIIDNPWFVTTHLMNDVVEESQLVTFGKDETSAIIIRKCSVQTNGSNNILLRPSMNSVRYLKDLDFLACCDGIFFFRTTMGQPVLLNPLRRELVELPLLPPQCSNTNSYEFYGFGFEFKSKVHKVVRISERGALVLTLGPKGSWREISCSIFSNHTCRSNGVTTHGYVHWLALFRAGKNKISEYCVISFDIENEEFMSTPFPKHIRMIPWGSLSYLASWKQSLAMVYSKFYEVSYHNVWIMKDLKTKEWEREFKTTSGTRRQYGERSYVPPDLLGEWKDGFLFQEGNNCTLYKPNNLSIGNLDVSFAARRGKLYLFSPNLTSFASYGYPVMETGVFFEGRWLDILTKNERLGKTLLVFFFFLVDQLFDRAYFYFIHWIGFDSFCLMSWLVLVSCSFDGTTLWKLQVASQLQAI